MDERPPPPLPVPPAPARSPRTQRRHLVAGAILFAGWTAAAGVYLAAASPVEDDEEYEMLHSKRSQRELERIAGKGAVLANDANEWIAGLFHGRALAGTIAVATGIVAAAYWVARRPPDDPATQKAS